MDGAGNAQSAAYAKYAWQLTLPAAYVMLTGGDLSQTVKRHVSMEAILVLPYTYAFDKLYFYFNVHVRAVPVSAD